MQPTHNAKFGVAGIAAFIWWLALLLLDKVMVFVA